jgi:hypothetical protein
MDGSIRSLHLMPPAPGFCQVCAAAAHGPEMPHNRDSLHYQFAFHAANGRSATWADAAADCTPAAKQSLLDFLRERRVDESAIGGPWPINAESSDGAC